MTARPSSPRLPSTPLLPWGSLPARTAFRCPPALLLPALLLGVLLCAPPAAASDAALAITGVTVLPMDAERMLPDQTVLVEDGRIAALGATGAVALPPGAEVVDGVGLFLLPGLFDTHVHFDRTEGEALLELHLAHGVTTVQSMHGSPWHLELRERVRRGELTGPRIVTTGPTTATERVDSPEKAAEVVRAQHGAGYDAVKMYGDGSGGMTEETYRRVIDEAHRLGMRVTGHAPRNHPFSLVLGHGQDSIDHLEEVIYTYQPILDVIGPLIDVQFGRAEPETVEAALADPDDLHRRLRPAYERLARDARAAGLAITPTLVAFRTIWQQTTPAYPTLLELPQMQWMHPLTRAEWGPGLNRYRSGGWADRLELMDKILGTGFAVQMEMVPHLAAAGVPILAGTDAPLTFVFPGWALHRELELLVEAGLTPYQALAAATSTAAAELGLAADSGTVAPGKRADLLLVEANPLEAIANTRRIAGVVAAGRWLPRAELDRRLEAVVASNERKAAQVEPLLAAFRSDDAGAIAEAFRGIEAPDEEVRRFAERMINSAGYGLLGDGEVEPALAAFRTNTELFADSANVWDSLGEGLLTAGRLEEALASYRKALEVDPAFDNPKSYVAFLEELAPALAAAPELSAEELARYAGDYGERHVRLREDGRLVYHRGEGEPRPLVPLAGHRFRIEGVWDFLMRFDVEGDGPAARIVGVYAQGHTDESVRGAPAD